MEREELTCNDLRYNNFKVFELCGYKAVMKKLEKKYSVHHKKRKIGNFTIGSNWVEVKHLTCTQRFWFKEYENFWHGWPDDKKCFWTRNKEFYVQRYQGELKIN